MGKPNSLKKAFEALKFAYKTGQQARAKAVKTWTGAQKFAATHQLKSTAELIGLEKPRKRRR